MKVALCGWGTAKITPPDRSRADARSRGRTRRGTDRRWGTSWAGAGREGRPGDWAGSRGTRQWTVEATPRCSGAGSLGCGGQTGGTWGKQGVGICWDGIHRSENTAQKDYTSSVFFFFLFNFFTMCVLYSYNQNIMTKILINFKPDNANDKRLSPGGSGWGRCGAGERDVTLGSTLFQRGALSKLMVRGGGSRRKYPRAMEPRAMEPSVGGREAGPVCRVGVKAREGCGRGERRTFHL